MFQTVAFAVSVMRQRGGGVHKGVWRNSSPTWRGPSVSSSRWPPGVLNRDDEYPSSASVEWLAVARLARCHSGPKTCAHPRKTRSAGDGSRSSSKARVAEWARPGALCNGGWGGIDDDAATPGGQADIAHRLVWGVGSEAGLTARHARRGLRPTRPSRPRPPP